MRLLYPFQWFLAQSPLWGSWCCTNFPSFVLRCHREHTGACFLRQLRWPLLGHPLTVTDHLLRVAKRIYHPLIPPCLLCRHTKHGSMGFPTSCLLVFYWDLPDLGEAGWPLVSTLFLWRCGKLHDQKQFGKEMVHLNDKAQLQFIVEEIRGKNRAKAETRCVEDLCRLAYSPWLAQLAYLISSRPTFYTGIEEGSTFPH